MGLSIGSGGIQITLLNNNASANRFTNQATERLATGQRINRASDDPAGLIAAEQARRQSQVGDLVQHRVRASFVFRAFGGGHISMIEGREIEPLA